MSTVFHNILRAVASAMEIPVVICLLLALAFAAFSVTMTDEELARLQEQNGVTGGGESLEKRGEVYYDAETGTYYIVRDSRSSGGS